MSIAKQQKAAAVTSETCPTCTAELIMRHLIIAEPLNAEGIRMIWAKRGTRGKTVIADLGVLSIERQVGPSYRLTVAVLGEDVLVATEGGYEIFRPGLWQSALEAIGAVLNERFGSLIDAPALN